MLHLLISCLVSLCTFGSINEIYHYLFKLFKKKKNLKLYQNCTGISIEITIISDGLLILLAEVIEH